MIEKIVEFVSKIAFGRHYLDGYIKDVNEKQEYKLVSLFPNDIAKEKATSVLQKDISATESRRSISG